VDLKEANREPGLEVYEWNPTGFVAKKEITGRPRGLESIVELAASQELQKNSPIFTLGPTDVRGRSFIIGRFSTIRCYPTDGEL